MDYGRAGFVANDAGWADGYGTAVVNGSAVVNGAGEPVMIVLWTLICVVYGELDGLAALAAVFDAVDVVFAAGAGEFDEDVGAGVEVCAADDESA